MSIKFLKQKTLDDLYSGVGANLDRYRSGNFDDLVTNESTYEFDKITFDLDNLMTVQGGDKNDAINSLTIYSAIEGMTPYLARDARIWCYLTHTYLLEYARNRWPIPTDDEKAVKYIVSHFFTKGVRGFERDNAASRLWWAAFACSKVNGIPLQKSLELLFYRQDVRSNIMDRVSTARIENLYSVILHKLNASFETDDRLLFDREINRSYMSEINFLGGSNVLETLSIDESSKALEEVDNLIFGDDIPVEIAVLETEFEPVVEEENQDYLEEIQKSTEDELRSLLEAKRDEIARVFPNTPDDKRLLSPTMIAGLLYQKPRDRDEFMSLFPTYIRSQISGEEAAKFLEEVFGIINENT